MELEEPIKKMTKGDGDNTIEETPIETHNEQETSILKENWDEKLEELPLQDSTENIIPNSVIVEEKSQVSATPIPKGKLFVVCLVQLCDALSLTSILPYLSQMTADLMGLDEEKEQKLVGYYGGFIISSYYLTQLVCSPIWGFLSDRFGRKPILLIGLLGTTLTCLMFGFTKWFFMALLIRGFYGFANGNIGIVKTYLREITDHTNQPRAFSILGTIYPIGYMIGPLIGGFLSRPAQKFPLLFNNFIFTTFPYLLPNILLAGIAFIGFITGIFFLSESNQRIINQKNEEISQENEVHQELKDDHDIEEPKEIIEDNIKESPLKRIKNWFKTSHLLSSTAFFSVLIYGILGFIQIVFNEVFPLWLWTPISNQGCGLEPYQIGIMTGIISVSVIFTQLIYTPWINNKFGLKKALLISNTLRLGVYFLIPEVRYLRTINIYLFAIVLIPLVMWGNSILESCFTSVIMMINNSVPVEELGTMNGIAQSSVAFCRTIGPTFGTTIFASSIYGVTPFPLDYHFTFYFCGILSIALSLIIYIRPEIKL